MKNYTEIVLGKPTDEFREYGMLMPWVMYFVISKKGNYIIKGKNCKQIETYIMQNLQPAIYYSSYWKLGESRGFWKCTIPNTYVKNRQSNKENKLKIMKYRNGEIVFYIMFRRMPKKWISLFDDFVNV